jgi:hypothetical protein
MIVSKPPSATGPTSTTNTCRWSEKESEKLFEAVTQHGSNWIAVARLIPGRNKTECQARWTAELDAARAAAKICMQPPQQQPLQVPQGQAPPQMLKKDEAIIVAKRPRFDSRKLKKDEDIQAAKRPRVDSHISTSVDVVGAPDWVVVASTYSATAASLEQPSIWKAAEEDTEPTESITGQEADQAEVVEILCKGLVAVAELVPVQADAQCPQIVANSLIPSGDPTIAYNKLGSRAEDAEPTENIRGEEADRAEVVQILGKGLAAVAELVPDQADAQCPQIVANSLIPSGDPTITDNKLGRWTGEEDTKLIAAVAALEKLGKKEWTEVAKWVPGRTNNQCRIRWIMQLDPSGGPTVNMGSWSEEEYVELVGAVKRNGSKLVSGRKNWSNELRLAVAATNPNASSLQQQPLNPPQGEAPFQQLPQAEDTQVAKRPLFDTPLSTTTASHNNVASTASAAVASHAQSPSVAGPITYTGEWTKEEKEKLFEAVEQHGTTNWIAVALLVSSRNKTQCQARWTYELDAARVAARVYASSPPPPRQRRPQKQQSQQCEAPRQKPAAKRPRIDTSHPISLVEVIDVSTADTMQQDEAIPAAKRPRFETSRPVAQVEGVGLSTADTGATGSCDDRVVVASTSSAMVASHAQPRNWWRLWRQQQ